MNKTYDNERKTISIFLVIIFTILNVFSFQFVHAANLVNSGFENGDLQGWSKGIVSDSVSVIGQDNYAFPYSGNYMACLGKPTSTAGVNQPMGNNEIYWDFNVTEKNLVFYYNVFTFDYTGYDEFTYKLTRVDTGEVLKSFVQGGWGPAGDTSLKSTGWQTVNLDMSSYIGENIRLTVNVAGTKDTLYATWAYVDFDENSINGNLIIENESGLDTVSEGSGNISYGVSLKTQPQSDVVINLTNDEQVKVSQNQLTFTHENWNVKQYITVSAVNDTVYEGKHFGKIFYKALSEDINYNGAEKTSTIYINDDETNIIGTYTVTAQVSSGEGTVSPQINTVKQGESANISIAPNSGYVAFVLDNGVNVTDKVQQNIYTLNNINEHHSISVTFTPSTPPKVLYTNPGHGSTNVPTNGDISIIFSEEVQAGDTIDNISLVDSSFVKVPTTKSFNGTKLTLNPNNELESNMEYSVIIPAGSVKNTIGNMLQSQYSFNFNTGQGENNIPTLSGISINPSSITMLPLEEKQLEVKALMSDGTTKVVPASEVTFTTSNESIATVDGNGLVKLSSTATAGYKAIITAQYNGKSQTCIVTTLSTATLSSISLNETSITLPSLGEKQLVVTATMSDGTTKVVPASEVTFTTSNESIATVDGNGLVKLSSTATAGYKAIITAQYNGKSQTCIVTTLSAATLSSISLNETSVTLPSLGEKQLVVTATMSDGTTKVVPASEVTFTTSNESIATVDGNGLVKLSSTATAGYKAIITAQYNGKSQTCIVTTLSAATLSSISLNETSISLPALGEKQLVVTATMSDGTTKVVPASEVTFTSSNTSIATVDANGLIKLSSTATAGYKAIITAQYNGKSQTCIVTTLSAATLSSISLNETSIALPALGEKQLVVTATMSDGTTKVVPASEATFTSSNTSIATVDANGLIKLSSTATAGYKAIITAKYGSKSQTCTVTTLSAATLSSISLNETSISLAPLGEKQLVVTATMSDGTKKVVPANEVTFTSSNTSIATVDANGLIKLSSTATAGYKAIITAKYGSKSQTCTVTTLSAPTLSSISLNETSIALPALGEKQLVVTATMSDGTTKVVPASEATFTSSNTSIATVDANGLIKLSSTATAGYKAIITVKYGSKSQTCTVTTLSAPTLSGISLNETSISLAPLGEKQLVVTATMSDGTTKVVPASEVTFTSSNTSIATVDANGLIKLSSTATAGYKAIITAKYGSKSQTCTVTVLGAPTLSSISLNETSIALPALGEKQLVVTATMSDGTTEVVPASEVTFTSSNTSIATVDANGLIKLSPTAVAGYKAIITVNYKGKAISCIVTKLN